MNRRPKIAVLGATGRTGQECLRILSHHDGFEVGAAFRSREGQPGLPARSAESPSTACLQTELLPVEPLQLDRLEDFDAVLVCAPHGASAVLDLAALERGCRVVDLSADFRLRDRATHERTYGPLHEDPAEAERLESLRERAVFGLTEFHRNDVREAQLVANPGCYPTSVALALKPLFDLGLLDATAPIHADCKSGVSGAGNTPSATNLFSNVHENFSAYRIGTHRHEPEMRQILGTDRLHFVPHLLPVDRGILGTLWFTSRSGVGLDDLRRALHDRYDAEAFVSVLDDRAPSLQDVQWTNRCFLHLAALGGDQFVAVSVIDNLVKGAAGQAIQNLNCMFGLEETAGLR